MKNEIKLLTGLELKNLFGWNVFRHTKDKKAKSRWLLQAAAWIVLLGIAVLYVGGLSAGLVMLGMEAVVPAYLVMISSLLIFVFDFFKAANLLFAKKGYDFLCALPVRTKSIVISRFLAMYVEDLLLVLVVMIPGIAVYGWLAAPEIFGLFLLMAGSLLIPCIPLGAALLLGTIILAIASRWKQKALVQTILAVLLVMASMALSFGAQQAEESLTPEMLSELAGTVTELIRSVYPPAVWLGNGAAGSISGMALFTGCSILAAAVVLGAVSKYFHPISQRLAQTGATGKYQMKAQKSSSVLKALYQREWKRYFSSGVYVSNTIIGPILAMILSAALLVAGEDWLLTQIPMEIPPAEIMPFVLAGIAGIMTTTSVSVSIEGQQFWIMKTLPVPVKSILDAKVLLNLSLLFPFYLISEICLILALGPEGWNLLFLILIPMILLIFTVVFGITADLRFGSFDWEKEETVVKQSTSAMIGGFAGMLTALIFGVIAAVLPMSMKIAGRALMCLGLAVVTLFLYRKNQQAELCKL